MKVLVHFYNMTTKTNLSFLKLWLRHLVLFHPAQS